MRINKGLNTMGLNRLSRCRTVALAQHALCVHHNNAGNEKSAKSPARLGILAAKLTLTPLTVGSLMMGLSSAAVAQVLPGAPQCVAGGTTVTCTGDLSSGVDVDGPTFDTLIINNLAAPGITPAAGVDGIFFEASSPQDIIIEADLRGASGIVTMGTSAEGIFAQQDGGVGDVSVTSTGDISTVGTFADGIFANQSSNSGDVSVTSTGDITTEDNASAGITSLQSAGAGDVSVTSTGNISTMGFAGQGIFADQFGGAGNVSVTSTGDITTTGTAAEGIFGRQRISNGNVSVTSAGNISTIGEDAEGIFALQAFGNGAVSVTSTGDISTVGEDAEGIEVIQFGGDGALSATSTGDISTVGDNAEGIQASQLIRDGAVNVTSIGNITTMGDDANGIFAEQVLGDGDVSVTSTGDITTTGAGSDGIFAEQGGGIGNILINSDGAINAGDIGIEVEHDGTGTIAINTAGSVSGVTGILVRDRDNNAAATITNSGVITGTGGTAINLQGNGNDVVTLLPGSLINGTIDFGNGNDGLGGTNPNDIDTLNFAAGLNAVVNFADADGNDSDLESAPEIINFDGTGVISNGGLTATATAAATPPAVAVAVDVTGFAALGNVLSDITDIVFNALDNATPVRAPSSGYGQTASFGQARQFGADLDLRGRAPSTRDDTSNAQDVRFWGALFGGVNEVGSTSRTVDFDHDFAGLVSGIEFSDIGGVGSFGLLGGYSISDVDLGSAVGDLDVDTGFGGIYLKHHFDGFSINAALLGGLTDNKQTRNVLGATANADFDGHFVSPSATISVPFNLHPKDLILRGRVSYLHARLDGYTETGNAAGLLTVDDRNLSLFNLRGVVNLPTSKTHDDGSRTDFNFSLGVDATLDAGSDDVNARTFATPFTFSTETVDQLAGLISVNASHTFAGGRARIGASAELQTNFGSDFQATGQLTASVRF